MNNNVNIRIKNMQNNLPEICKLLGWSASALGNKIGVTKQTISNLENKKSEIKIPPYGFTNFTRRFLYRNINLSELAMISNLSRATAYIYRAVGAITKEQFSLLLCYIILP